MPRSFHVTFDIVTPESAARGDFAKGGFVDANGWHVDMPESVFGEAAGKIKADCAMTLREAITNISCCFDSGSGGFVYYEADGTPNYKDGSEERRALHLPDNATASTVARVARLLKYIR